jgi:hypothetical protein
MSALQVSKRFGETYGLFSTPGSQTIFCPSCPQPGINLPTNWKNLPHWVTRRTITVDGNFHADHIRMRRPDLDVMLTDGQGYMAGDAKYREYLAVAKELPVVSLWSFSFVFVFYVRLYRGHPVGIIEQLIPQTPTIDATWMLPGWSPAAVLDTVVSFPLRFVICKREKGEGHFWHLLRHGN